MFRLTTFFPNGSRYNGHPKDLSSAIKLMNFTMKMLTPLVEGVVLEITEFKNGKWSVLMTTARDEKGIGLIEEKSRTMEVAA